MRYEKQKDKITELQNFLNSVAISDNLHSLDILQISMKLDNLIVDYYSELIKEKKKSIRMWQ